MRATRITAIVVLSAAVATPAWGTLRVLKSDGEAAAPHEAVVSFNPGTGGWDVTLLALYAPGDWSAYNIHGDDGETIDNLVIDVPCWEDSHGNCIPAGSPVVVRVISDDEDGVRAVNNIVQTGTAETLLNLVDVREDIGRVEVEAVGILRAGRDVVGPVHATTRDNAGRGINRVEAGRDILGNLSAELGFIKTVLAYGRVGTAERPVTIRAKHGVEQVASYGGIRADIDARINGGHGTTFALGGPYFYGTLVTEALESPYEGWPARISVWGRFEGGITIGRPFDDADEWMEFVHGGIGGQIIVNADNVPGGAWTSPIYLGFEGDPLRHAIAGPHYPDRPARLGGGSIGVAPFALHAEACDPAGGAVVGPGGLGAVRLRHYGPIETAGVAPLRIERRPLSGGDFESVPLGDFRLEVDPADANTLVVTGTDEGPVFADGHEYRVQATADLVSAVADRPPVAWRAAYHVTVEGAPCRADLDGSGAVDLADVLRVLHAWGPCDGCPEDLDENGTVGFTDLLALLKAWGPC